MGINRPAVAGHEIHASSGASSRDYKLGVDAWRRELSGRLTIAVELVDLQWLVAQGSTPHVKRYANVGGKVVYES